jgi:hypothetical protein
MLVRLHGKRPEATLVEVPGAGAVVVASLPAMTPEADPVGGSPIMPRNPVRSPAPALPHEQSPASGRSTMKVAIAIFLFILVFGLILLFSEWGKQAATVSPKRDAVVNAAGAHPAEVVRSHSCEKRMSGIYVLEADFLKICFNQNDAGERPKTFATDRETELSLIVLKRQKP